MPKATGSCEVCGSPIEFFPSQKRRYCSNAHAQLALGRKRRETGIGRAPRPHAKTGRTINCIVCGTSFYARANELARGRRYCSRRCSGTKDKKPRMDRPCDYCGTVMHLRPSDVSGGKRFCSKRCNALGTTQSWTLLDRTYNGMPVKQDPKGYIWVWAPERGYKDFGGWYQEHRIVVEAAIGRPLARDEHVHHKGMCYPVEDPRNKSDNRLENLQVLLWLDHAVISLQEHRDFLKREANELAEYRRRYGPLDTTP